MDNIYRITDWVHTFSYVDNSRLKHMNELKLKDTNIQYMSIVYLSQFHII